MVTFRRVSLINKDAKGLRRPDGLGSQAKVKAERQGHRRGHRQGHRRGHRQGYTQGHRQWPRQEHIHPVPSPLLNGSKGLPKATKNPVKLPKSFTHLKCLNML